MSVGHSQRMTRRNLWQGPTLSHLLTWAGCSQPTGGDIEAAGKNKVLKFTVQLTLWFNITDNSNGVSEWIMLAPYVLEMLKVNGTA